MSINNYTAKAREAAKRLTIFTATELAEQLGVQTYKDLRRVRNVIHEMHRTGEISSVDRGYYQYAAMGPMGRRNDVFRKICRAMHLKGSFSAKDVKKLTDADISYIRSVIRKFKKAETVRKVGQNFEIVNRDKFYLEHVK